MKTDFETLFRIEMDKLSKQKNQGHSNQKKRQSNSEQDRTKRNKELDRPSGQQIDRYV